MASRIYPTNATRGGAATLTGAGSVNDIFTFASPVKIIVQNDTAAAVYVSAGNAAATQGDEAVPAGSEWASDDISAYVGIYGAAATHVNGTVASGLVIYGLVLP